MPFDERAYLTAGLARLMQAKYPNSMPSAPGRVAADSSSGSSVDEVNATSDKLGALGLRTTEVSAE